MADPFAEADQAATGTVNTIHVSHVALQQTEFSGHVVMQASDLRMLMPEVDQNIMRGLILVGVTLCQAQGECHHVLVAPFNSHSVW